MNRSGEEQEQLLALLEEEAKRSGSHKGLKDQREGEMTWSSPTVIRYAQDPYVLAYLLYTVIVSWTFIVH